MTRVVAFALALAAAALLGASDGSAVRAQNPKLFGTVGPGFSILLEDAQGSRVRNLEPGTYDVQVEDLSGEHNFHLEGPGVDERTEVAFTGTVNWTVTFRDGRYVYHCDPHPSLRGTFTVGPPSPPPPPGSPPPPSVITPTTKLVVTAGPKQVITLRTAAGKAVKQLRRGTYTVTVRDRSRIHNVHLSAPGYDRKTTPLTFIGTQTWKVKLARVGTFRYRCDPHAALGMRGSAKIVA